MSLGPVIDVSIGLIFVYLLMGLIVSAAQELVVAWIGLRGQKLRDAIAGLLADGKKADPLFVGVFEHALVRSTKARSLPSYLPSRNFALALIDMLSDGSKAPPFVQIEQRVSALPQGTARDALMLFVRNAGGDLDALKASIATWYDDAMDRLTGAYKRWSQAFAIIAGFVIAVVLNVDSIRIADQLWRDETLRANVVAAADAYRVAHTEATPSTPTPGVTTPQSQGKPEDAAPGRAERSATPSAPVTTPSPIGQSTPSTTPASGEAAPNTPAAPSGLNSSDKSPAPAKNDIATARTNLSAAVTQLTDLKLPIGWNAGSESCGEFECVRKHLCSLSWLGIVLMVLGWIITGTATSLGAPFWFDMLKNVLNLRGAGPKPLRNDGQERGK